jgi:hypothetical protein
MNDARLWIARAVSFCVAWLIVYLFLAICDELFSIDWLMPVAIGWICVSVLAKAALYPTKLAKELPIGIDVGAALRFLANSGAWPFRAFKRRR